ncbi:hypothetical protein F7734_36570 [Scytonema sp. UIC 10036]|uniref:hypothetical protein n=1 Tax=Scytonema sp. UIC 10036 TaxID=2304196 RepID=UPI0012DA5998|nr:hypothetical protein [Scytonema sp. UIC 10036]MUG97546.1 hypothetical protein [Scytonema sp. UIC 10036]
MTVIAFMMTAIAIIQHGSKGYVKKIGDRITQAAKAYSPFSSRINDGSTLVYPNNEYGGLSFITNKQDLQVFLDRGTHIYNWRNSVRRSHGYLSKK